jgi:predicted phage gp36 major capsid-like protein
MSTERLTEILKYLSAMSRDIGDFRAEIKARFEKLETRADHFEGEMRTAFEDVRKDLRRLRHSFEHVSEVTTELKIENRDLRKRVEALEKKVGIEDDL